MQPDVRRVLNELADKFDRCADLLRSPYLDSDQINDIIEINVYIEKALENIQNVMTMDGN